MAVLDKHLTIEEVREDITGAIRSEFNMSVAEFRAAVANREIPYTERNAVNEILSWMSSLPPSDPLFENCDPKR